MRASSFKCPFEAYTAKHWYLTPDLKQEIHQYLTDKCGEITLPHNPCGHWRQQGKLLISEADCNGV